MATLTTYESYKPSGIDWIGDIPSHWDVKKLKFAVARIDEEVDQANFLIAVENIQSGTGKLVAMDEDKSYQGAIAPFRKGDVIFNKLRPYLAKVYHAQQEGGCFGELLVLRGNQDMAQKYLFYRLISQPFIDVVNSSTEGTKMPRANWDDFIKQLPLPLPPLAEQAAIARYLDTQTTQLDTLIDRKRRLMDLLREEKAALINEAVTKGINPGVAMKDSGIAWLGEVPAHWEVKKLKHVATVRSGFALNATTNGENDIKLPYLRVANVQDGYLKLLDIAEVSIDANVAPRYHLRRGDLLMNEGGDNDKLGRGCVWRDEIEPCLHQNHVFAVRMKESINTDWVNMLTITTYARQYFFLNCKQSTNLASISQTNIKELPILLPPDYEQNEILAYLNTETARIDHTISRIEREVELMQEYRTALISEVVTGKVCVV